MPHNMKKWIPILLCAVPLTSFALDIQQAYRLTIKNSNRVKASQAAYQAASSEASVGTRAWLPSINAEGFFNRGNFDGSPTTTRADFDGVDIIARETLFDYSAIAEAMGAKYVRQLASYKNQLVQQEEIRSTIKAYFDLLLSRQLLKAATLNKRLLKTGLYQITVAKNLNLKTPDQVAFVQSDYDDAIADYLRARTAYSDSIAQLEHMVQSRVHSICPLRPHVISHIQPPPPLSVWERRARHYNLALRALQVAEALADKRVSMEVGKHLPTVSAVGSYNVLHNKGVLAYDGHVYGVAADSTHVHGYTVGLKASIPLFSGGVVSAEVDSAEQKRQEIFYKLAQLQSDIALKTRNDYLMLVTDYAKIKAQRGAMRASHLAYQLSIKEMQEHTKTELDVLKAQAKYDLALQKYEQSVFDYFKRYIDLHADAGELNNAVIFEINQYINANHCTRLTQFDRYPLSQSMLQMK